LITPCPCSGSIRYVHHLCLKRWATIRPVNGQICSICKAPFTLFLEVLPIRSTTVTLLENSALIGTAFIYLAPAGHVRAVHLSFQILYLLAVVNVFYVRNLRVYLIHQLQRSLPYMALTYAGLLYRLIQHNDLACCFFINITLFLTWLDHIRVLEMMNTV
jgi:E3 ubiquitin-protein ligase DOA10